MKEVVCKICKEKKEHQGKGMCGRCYRREYRQKNKERIAKVSKIWYGKNREKVIKYHKEYGKRYEKKTNYARFKTPDKKKTQAIKRKTRTNFSLENQYCIFCSNKAVERHHITQPIEFDKFIFLCKDCHSKVHKNMKEVRLLLNSKEGAS